MSNNDTTSIDSIGRTKAVKVHIPLTFIYKILAVALSFMLIPLTINYLDVEQYGIWLTLFSMMSWISFFDIGLGKGMRNKLTEALSINDIKLAKTYVSTAYAAVIIIALILFVVLLFALSFTPWEKIFNTSTFNNRELSRIIFISGFFFIVNFILTLCNQVFYAYQKASLATVSQLLHNLFALLLIYALIQFTSGRLLYLATCYGLSMVFANLFLTFYFYKKHGEITPSLSYIDSTKIKEISSLGLKFFVIQLAVLMIFATDNMIITQVLGPEHVAPYNIMFKLFSIVTILHGIILAPLWSAYTDAFAKGDFLWIRRTLKKLNLLMIPIIIFVLILIIFARDIINIWVGPDIKFPSSLVVLMGIYTVISIWSNVYAYFVNGVGKIRPQMYSAILGGLINIPLSVYFAKYLDMGISGVILGTIISLSLFAVIGPIQSYYILNQQRPIMEVNQIND